MAGPDSTPTPDRQGLGRRRFLGYAGSAVAGAVAGTAGGAAWGTGRDGHRDGGATRTGPGAEVSPYGVHQPGVAAPTPPVVELVALDLLPDVDRDALGRLLRAWTGDVEALATGRATPGDTEPWLAAARADLTITVGLGPGTLTAARVDPPRGFEPVPPMRHDRLEPRWSGGDLVLVVGGREGTTVAHAVRQLVRDARPFARERWRQAGFWNGVDPEGRPMTGRNLFGQIDGTANPVPGTEAFDETVWLRDPPWTGGSTLVVRRIAMDLDTWAELTRDRQERSLGRRLDDGARLDDPGPHAHARLAHPMENAGARILRRGASYASAEECGLLFCSFQASLAGQFVPIQRSLDRADALNTWTTATGSAVFVVLPGFERGDWLGSTVLG
ncbi:Dyp-type peroxidase [Nocardioides sp.]|uniref:Dyp-type peroxidase n=1 Tax=Nocardioides sp. TaxID=35761 RepID=UPI0026096364|nr:Dyp-type peroxidase [Nocardioides sp.]MDI6911933.1 Dyp-type peroxidase [Nocardioides sp.]